MMLTARRNMPQYRTDRDDVPKQKGGFMMLEVSDTLSSDNLINLTSGPANWTTSIVRSSYASDSAWLKIEGPEKSRAITVSFDSDHAPGWGDFYATDGRRQHLYNEGLGSTDPHECSHQWIAQ